MDTHIKKVTKFYDFWTAFNSWRDFKVEDEYDVEQAENRWEKRQMEKENKKLKNHLLKKEKIRINKLINRAQRNDPRLINHEKAEREKREKRKAEIEIMRNEKRDAENAVKEKMQKEKVDKQNAAKEAKVNAAEAAKNKRFAKKQQKKDIIRLYTTNIPNAKYNAAFLEIFLDSVKQEEKDWILEEL